MYLIRSILKKPKRIYFLFYLFVLSSLSEVLGQDITDFSIPSKVCVNESFQIQNLSTNVQSSFWTFCSGNLNTVPKSENLGNPNNLLVRPVFIDYAFHNGKYYGFSTNNDPSSLIRYDFGNSLLNTPTVTNLGDFSGKIPGGAEGIQLVQNEGRWYAIIVGGDGANFSRSSAIIKVDFGMDLGNVNPVVTNWGNIGGLNYPIDLHLFKDGTTWYGYTVNANGNTITRFNFSSSFSNVPTGQNLGNFSFNGPTGIFAFKNGSNWHLFVTNEAPNTGSPSLTRLDFGNSLLNTPNSVNLGNPNNVLSRPRDITLFKNCDDFTALVVNFDQRSGGGSLSRLNFGSDLLSTPIGTNFGNTGGLNFPHSISKVFRDGGDLYAFTTNVLSNTITKFKFESCSDASIPNSTQFSPPIISYSQPGLYTINLLVNEGLPNQNSICKQILVTPPKKMDFSYENDVCDPNLLLLKPSIDNFPSQKWNVLGQDYVQGNLSLRFSNPGIYPVKLEPIGSNSCYQLVEKNIEVREWFEPSLIPFNDTLNCKNEVLRIDALDAYDYCWTERSNGERSSLSFISIGLKNQKEIFSLKATRLQSNLIQNGDFQQGNIGFESDFNFNTSSSVPGNFFIGNDINIWASEVSECKPLLPSAKRAYFKIQDLEEKVAWRQRISIQPQTNYVFKTKVGSIKSNGSFVVKFKIDSVELGAYTFPDNSSCDEFPFFIKWNSGNKPSAVIEIYTETLTNQICIFSLDSVHFSSFNHFYDSLQVGIFDPLQVSFSLNETNCKTFNFQPTKLTSHSSVINWSWVFDSEGTTPPKTISRDNSDPFENIFKNGGNQNIKLTATDNNGCSTSVMQSVLVDTLAVRLLNSDTTICPNVTFDAKAIVLQEDPSVVYSWTLLDPNGGIITGSNSSSASIAVKKSNGIKVVAENSKGCSDSAVFQTIVRPLPNFIPPPDVALCADSMLVFLGTANESFHHEWGPSEWFNDPKSKNPAIKPDGSGTFFVKLSDPVCGADTVFERNVTVHPNPTLKINKSNDVDCQTPFAQLSVQGASSYYWNPGPGISNITANTVRITPNRSMYFSVSGTNEFGCSSRDSVLVTVSATNSPFFNLPNAFTPNGDGHNDCFSLKSWGNAEILEFSIFSRWGERVFSGKSTSDCWDGTFKGVILPVGDYVYHIRAKTLCGEVVKKGAISLIR
jgi:gliding motility-associated-like protein